MQTYAKYTKKQKAALSSTSEIIKKKLFVSKDPMGLAGAIVYMNCKKMGRYNPISNCKCNRGNFGNLKEEFKINRRILKIKSFMIFVCF